MAEILGLGVTDFPTIRLKPNWLPGPLVRLKNTLWAEAGKPELQDPKNWPKPMRDEWGDDEGLATSTASQQHQIGEFRKLKAALDDFKPDFMVAMYREHTDTFGNFARFQYNIQAHEGLTTQFFKPFGRTDTVFEGMDTDRMDTLPGHREGALHLVRKLQDRGLNPFYTLEAYGGDAPGAQSASGQAGQVTPVRGRHNLISAAVHLDWDKRELKTPIVPMGFDPFGFCRTRNDRGLSPWERSLPRPLLPTEAFELGRAMAQIYKASPWRVALVAAVDWSHKNDSGWDHEQLHPNVEADRKRYEEWKNNQFHKWGDEGNWTFEEMEANAQWELLVTITLAGAMAEIGAKVEYSDFYPHYIINDSFVTTIFGAK